jgi:hypothetical protein
MDGLSYCAVRILGALRLVQQRTPDIRLLAAEFTRHQMDTTLPDMRSDLSSGERLTALGARLQNRVPATR